LWSQSKALLIVGSYLSVTKLVGFGSPTFWILGGFGTGALIGVFLFARYPLLKLTLSPRSFSLIFFMFCWIPSAVGLTAIGYQPENRAFIATFGGILSIGVAAVMLIRTNFDGVSKQTPVGTVQIDHALDCVALFVSIATAFPAALAVGGLFNEQIAMIWILAVGKSIGALGVLIRR
jgi:hypothetical protein